MFNKKRKTIDKTHIASIGLTRLIQGRDKNISFSLGQR